MRYDYWQITARKMSSLKRRANILYWNVMQATERHAIFIFHIWSYILSSIFLYKFGCAIVVVRRRHPHRSLEESFSALNISFRLVFFSSSLWAPYISPKIERKWAKTKANVCVAVPVFFLSFFWFGYICSMSFCCNLQRIIHLVCIASGTWRRLYILCGIETHTHLHTCAYSKIISHGIQIR